MKLNLFPFELSLKHPFTISRGTITTQPTLVVELEADGLSGYGEATTNDYYGRSLEKMIGILRENQNRIEAFEWDKPRQLWDALAPELSSDPFAQCALDQAAYDLWGKRLGRPVHELLDWPNPGHSPPSNYTLGIDTPTKMLAKMQEFPDWPVYKIKLGGEQDLETLRFLRPHTEATVSSGCQWRLDRRADAGNCPATGRVGSRTDRATAACQPRSTHVSTQEVAAICR